MTPRSHFGSQFAQCESDLAAGNPDWLAAVRRAAIHRFDELGLPTRKDEAWKYTSTAAIEKADLLPTSAPGVPALSVADVHRIFGAPTADCRLVFENGTFAPHLGEGSLPTSIEARAMAGILRDDPRRLEELLAAESQSIARPFDALNLAFVRDGVFVSIGASETRHAIEILFVTTAAGAGRAANLRNIIRLDAGATATVSLHFATDSAANSLLKPSGGYLTNAVTRVELGDDAELDLVSVQRESDAAFHLSSIDVIQGRDSRFRSHLFALGGGLARSEVNSVLAAPGADCALNGLFLGDGRRHIDNQTVIDHASPHGTSRELYKGVLGGRSRGVFNGLVRVRTDAQKTHAQQSNPNLLVSDLAHVNTKPTLEINADDVKCSHGATIGRLDEDALFYLRARGVDERTANEILVGAFAAEITDAIPHEALRAEIRNWVGERLAAVAADTSKTEPA